MMYLFFGVMGGLVALDLITKWIMSNVEFVQIIPGIFSFSYMTNPGVAFGMGAENVALRWLVISFALLVAGGGIFAAVRYRRSVTKLLAIGGGLFIGGTVGNLVDRIFNGGKVRDFLYVEFINNTSNFADWGITAGVILLGIWILFFYDKKDVKQK